jgi:hypothetical protein
VNAQACRPWSLYKITHIESGHQYIGLTSRDAPLRWRQHVWDAGNDGRCKSALHRAIRKHGAAAFEFEVLAMATGGDAARLMERDLIAQHGTMRPAGFNLTSGGEMAVGVKVSAETRRKISHANLRRCNGGPAFPPRSREARSAATKAYYAANPKQPETDQTIRRKSDAAKAYWAKRQADAAAGKIDRVGHKPHGMSPQARANVSAGIKRHWAEKRRPSLHAMRAA